jgi:FkbM family methyltransferase
MMPVRTLYICYFGLREPLVQTQVLPYLRQLISGGIQVSLLTFESRSRQTWSAREIAEQRAALKAEGISWHWLKYHKWPSLPATLYDIGVGTWAILRIMRREGVDVLHARNHVSALMGALAKRMKRCRLIFDIRGFMPEEYTDAGVWPANGFLYRGLKRVERYLFRTSDGFVVLTKKARDILFPVQRFENTDNLGRPIEVIPCCVDLQRFNKAQRTSRESVRTELNLTDRRVIVYIGSFGGGYMTDEMMEFLAVAHRQDWSTFSMILTQSPRQMVDERMSRLGIAQKDVFVAKVDPEEVPRYLKAADIAILFIKPCYSKQSSSPTKIAEYLASGLPVVCTAGIGDLDTLIEENRAGVLLREFTAQAYRKALNDVDAMRADKTLGEHLRGVARKEFDLASIGGIRYLRLYWRLLNGVGGSFSATAAVHTRSISDGNLNTRPLDAKISITPKTRVLNFFRAIFKVAHLESWLASSVRGRSVDYLICRLVPNPYQYPPGSFRGMEQNGIKMKVDISDYIGHYLYFGFEDKGMEKLFSLCKGGFNVLDVGTNIGWTALNLANLCGNGQVIGFEPDPYNFESCTENIRLNRFTNIRVFPLGVGDKNQILPMEVRAPSNRGGNRIAVSGSSDEAGVEVTRLDDFAPVRELPSIDLIKVDVEGYELKVLRGAERLLRALQPLLFIELDDNNLKDQQDSAAELIEFLLNLGYPEIHAAETGERISPSDDFSHCHFDIIARSSCVCAETNCTGDRLIL